MKAKHLNSLPKRGFSLAIAMKCGHHYHVGICGDKGEYGSLYFSIRSQKIPQNVATCPI